MHKNDFLIRKHKLCIVSFLTRMDKANQILEKLNDKFNEFMYNPYTDSENLERSLGDAKVYFDLHRGELSDELCNEFKEWFSDEEDECELPKDGLVQIDRELYENQASL